MRLHRILIIGCVCASGLTAGMIRGSVRSNGRSVPGAIVTASCGGQTLSTVTKEDGNFSFDVPSRRCSLLIERSGYVTYELSSEFLPQPLILELAPEPPQVRRTAPEAYFRASEISEAEGTEAGLIEVQFLPDLPPPSYTLSGASSIHGSAFWTFRDAALDARPFSLSGHPVDKADYSQHRFGGAIGGPLKIPHLLTFPRTFFYVSYTGVRSSIPYTAGATLPLAVERAGNFSAAGVGASPVIYDPNNRQPFANNIIPFSRINPAARGLLNLIPSPNQPGKVQNYQLVTSVPSNSDILSGRLDRALSTTQRLTLSVARQNREGQLSQLYGFLDDYSGRVWSADIALTQTLSSRGVNVIRLSYSRNRADVLPFFAYGRDWASDLGITGTSKDEINYGPPNLRFTNFGGLNDSSPMLRTDVTFAASDGFSYNRGNHNVSAGGDYRRILSDVRTDQNGRGTFTFTGLSTSGFDTLRNPLPSTGFDFADLLLGLPQSGSIRYGSSDNAYRGASYSAYLQDDWHWKPNLSLNLGVRYDYASPFHEKRNQMANLSLDPAFSEAMVVTAGESGFPATLIDPDRNNIAPRVGLAWRPSSKVRSTVRAGYGIFYNNSVYATLAARLASQPPFASTTTVTTSAATVLTLQDGFRTTQAIRNTYAVDPGYRLGFAQSWNVSLQHELPGSLVMEAAYLGVKGSRLDLQRQPNRAMPGSPLDAETRRMIRDAVSFTLNTSSGNAIDHAGQFKLIRRFAHSISMNAAYTFAKSIDDLASVGGAGTVVAQDDRNLASERGLSTFDRRHTLHLTGLFVSPDGTSKWFRNWTLSTGWLITSGSPFTARVLGNRADIGGTGVIGSGRADVSGLAVDGDSGYFNTDAFTLPLSTRFGTAGRNTIPGPWNNSLQAAFGRSFQITDRKQLEVRMESQNILNQANITRLNSVVNALSYGWASAAGPMRNVSAHMRFRF